MANESVARFRAFTDDVKAQVRADSIAELNVQADRLVAAMEAVVPRGATGELEHSIRKIPGSKPSQVRIIAGGALTVRKSVSSKPYDYARADEFGTTNMQARPFFFPTYRLMKKKIKAAMSRKLTATIKKRSLP